MTEAELIEGVLSRDRNAIKYLVGQYQEKVIRTTFGFLRNMEDAEDLSQEVFLEVIRALPSFRRSSSLSTWIYRITVNKSLNHMRKNMWRKIFSGLTLHGDHEKTLPVPDIPVSGTDGHEGRELKKILDKAIDSLSENQRIAFVLHKYEDFSYKQIAEIMNVSLSSVESLIHRAKSNLQKRLIVDFPEYIKP
jgi:RNA polymerase sigma-70 factor, ECF subfamily